MTDENKDDQADQGNRDDQTEASETYPRMDTLNYRLEFLRTRVFRDVMPTDSPEDKALENGTRDAIGHLKKCLDQLVKT